MNRGTTPAGAQSEEQAARWVRGMFDRVAPRYDLLNHLLSFQLDRWWRARTIRELRPMLEREGVRVVDLCCGSGDLLAGLQSRAGGVVFGADFSHNMLLAARKKIAQRGLASQVFEGDALSLPVADLSLDLVTAAFGFRNLSNYRKGLAEMWRVLKPGGVAAILEFSTPRGAAFGAVYSFFSRRVLPAIGGAISGSREAYSYLPESIRKFPDAEQLAEQMREAGFADVTFHRMTGGAVALHTGKKN